MHTASRNDRLDVIRLLLESPTDIGIQNENPGTPPLALASYNGQLDVSRSPIWRGANSISSLSDDAAWTPSDWAARYGRLDMRLLLDRDKGAAVDMQREIPWTWTPLHPALADGTSNSKKVKGRTPLRPHAVA